MAFNDIELANIEKCMEFFIEKRRPPAFVRDEVDLQYHIIGTDVVIYRINYIEKKKYETPIAKIALNRTHTGWNLYSMIQPNQWIAAIKESIPTFSDAIKIVEDDLQGCFFG
ncbi:DUF3024 domain-containing protein [Providencia rustigianii]|uniref:DUF3024 domain-containing protein n=1 Tax=Providencia rustigianii TaxID=158850 RepID=UPI0038B26EBB